MARTIRRKWQATLDAGLPRRDRTPCDYEAYIPDPLGARKFRLEGDVAADVADAQAAISDLNASATTLSDTEALARLLLRAESVASSKIEGLEVGGRKLLREEAARSLGEQSTSVTAGEVLGNIDAMVWAVETASAKPSISVADILAIHERLLANTALGAHAGKIRTGQNWIGGSDHNPCSADFVPPPPEHVEALLVDLCSFCNEDSLPAVAQAAIAHAQFESIHPFVDGNGRTGRALIHTILRRRGLATRVTPPLSLILATWAKEYVLALNGTRYRGNAGSAVAHNSINRWIALFAAACTRSVVDATAFEGRIRRLQDDWRRRLGSVRRNSSADVLVKRLPGVPIVTVNGASDLTGRTFQATNEAIERLVTAGILAPITVGRRNRTFEAREIIDAFTDLERQLASPAGDTRT